MLSDRIEGKWIEAFAAVFAQCAVKEGDPVVVLSETQSRQVNVHLAELGLLRLGAHPVHVVVPTPPQRAPAPIRSTGATDSIQGAAPVMNALKSGVLIVDLTVEAMLHAPETVEVLKSGSRILVISNEHPELLERVTADEDLKARVKRGTAILKAGKTMRVRSAAGTDLTVNVEDALVGAGWGYTDRPGTITHWPGGLCLCFPKQGAVSGTLVLNQGDLNLTFKRYLESPVRLQIVDDYVEEIAGDGVDADLMRSYFAAWGDREAYAVSHVGWGMNHRARWDALTMYDRAHVNGTEQRVFAGNFLYSTGANETVGRYTLGHFDLPLKDCTLHIDDTPVLDAGRLVGDLA
ncbi:MAG: peptidase M29 [Pseudomonadota bacterium]